MNRSTILALLLDAVLVVAFAATGRASHDSHVLTGLWQTSWPFLAGLVVGWAVVRGWRAPTAALPTGLVVWGATVVGGMLLRAVSGQGTALPFIIVATLTLLALLVGWRLVALGVRALRSRSGERSHSRDAAPRA
ncbi:DUF3054 domain-containing protein [Microbacterium arborescens]|jgi:uncharacterized membrane protein|uniref:DUF3054 domain-containing protein n=1 Tax=Microbacterium arborescens TaxID=33883 RepID=UPI003C784E1B